MTSELRQALTNPMPRKPEVTLLPSGSTLFDLACSGTTRGAWPIGTYNYFVGDTQSGKTLVCCNTLAEAAINPFFDGYDLIYSNPERRQFWDVEAFWGPKLKARMMPPAGTRENPQYCRTVQDLYYFLYDRFEWDGGRVVAKSKKKRPFVWIEDSMASLDELAKWAKFEYNREMTAEGKDDKVKGSYGMSKQKVNSDNILWVVNALADTGSILIVINQTRDRVPENQWDYGPKKTVSGGHALHFYACQEVWSSVEGQIKKDVNKIERQIGTDVRLTVKKNSINGRLRSVVLPVFSSFGIDDVGSCVDYLVEEKHWTKEDGKIKAPEFDHDGRRDKLIALIEEQELESELKRIVQKVWDDVEEQCRVIRKPRYT